MFYCWFYNYLVKFVNLVIFPKRSSNKFRETKLLVWYMYLNKQALANCWCNVINNLIGSCLIGDGHVKYTKLRMHSIPVTKGLFRQFSRIKEMRRLFEKSFLWNYYAKHKNKGKVDLWLMKMKNCPTRPSEIQYIYMAAVIINKNINCHFTFIYRHV